MPESLFYKSAGLSHEKWWKTFIIFCIMLKVLFVLRIFKVLSWLFGHAKKWLDKKGKINFNIYDVTDWTQINTMRILPNISKSKGNQTMKFGLLIEYNTINIFLQNCAENLFFFLVGFIWLKSNWSALYV